MVNVYLLLAGEQPVNRRKTERPPRARIALYFGSLPDRGRFAGVDIHCENTRETAVVPQPLR
jgi:hypothetical protein